MICPKCGNQLPDGSLFCNRCGNQFAAGGAGRPMGQAPQGGAYNQRQPGGYGQQPPQGGSPYNQAMGGQGYQQPYGQQPPSTPPQKKSPLVPILISVIAVLLVGGGILAGVLLLGGKDNGEETVVQTESSATPAPTLTPTPVPLAEEHTDVETEEPEETPTPTKAPYILSLKNLNYEIQLNKKITTAKVGLLKYKRAFNKRGKPVKRWITCTIRCRRRSVGKKYKTTFTVYYKMLNNPKMSSRTPGGKWGKQYFCENFTWTIFDARTGYIRENSGGVKSKQSKWRWSYYPRQYCDHGRWYHKNEKALRYSFTMTYPKSCKDLCVGIGFINRFINRTQPRNDRRYWNGKAKYGKTSYYKKGRQTMSYIWLK